MNVLHLAERYTANNKLLQRPLTIDEIVFDVAGAIR